MGKRWIIHYYLHKGKNQEKKQIQLKHSNSSEIKDVAKSEEDLKRWETMMKFKSKSYELEKGKVQNIAANIELQMYSQNLKEIIHLQLLCKTTYSKTATRITKNNCKWFKCMKNNNCYI